MTTNHYQVPFSVFMISLSQGLGLSCAVIAVTVAAVAGVDMTDTPFLATLPYGLQFASMIPASLISSNLMRTQGRKKIILIATLSGVASGVIGAWAVQVSSLLLLSLAHVFLGVFLSNVQLLRFAALDITNRNIHPKVITLVLLGGVFAALIGPTLARNSEAVIPVSGYAAAYATISVLALVVGIIISCINIPTQVVEKSSAAKKTIITSRSIIQRSGFLFAAFCAGGGYFLMSLLMVASSLFLHLHPMLEIEFDTISLLIQGHVLAMYLPALFSGKILKSVGIFPFLLLGTLLQIASNLFAIFGDSVALYFTSLILLGVAWNVLYTSGTFILGQLFTGDEKFKAQGLNDMAIALLSTVATLFAASFLVILGWNLLNIFSIIISLAILLYALMIKQKLERICQPDSA